MPRGPLLNNGYAENTYNIDVKQSLWINTVQSVTTSATSAQSAVVADNTNRVVISVTQDTWISIGASPTAAAHTAGSFFLSGGSQSYPLSVTPTITKIAAIQDSVAGYVSIIESQ